MMDIIASVEENQRDIEWLKGIIGAYGHMLAREGRTIKNFLRGTIGSTMWLDGLNDEEWSVLWNEIMPLVFKEARQRGETGEGDDGQDNQIKETR